jgi:PhnB protein
LIIPMLICRDAGAEVEFCQRAFGAFEVSRRSTESGAVVHAALKVGEAMVMIHAETPPLASRAPQLDGTSPVVVYLYVTDVDVVIAQAIAVGARLQLPAEDQFWGDRVGRIIDPAGHVWNVAGRLRTAE